MAMERNRFNSLPGRVYAVGFVRIYAAFVGLDSEPLVARVKAEMPTPEIELPAVNVLPARVVRRKPKVPEPAHLKSTLSPFYPPVNANGPGCYRGSIGRCGGGLFHFVCSVLQRTNGTASVRSVPPNLVAEARSAEQQLALRPSAGNDQPSPVPPRRGARTCSAAWRPDGSRRALVAPAAPLKIVQVEPLPPPAAAPQPAPAPTVETVAELTPEVAPSPPAVVRPKPARPAAVASTVVSLAAADARPVPGSRAPLRLGRNYGRDNRDARIILRAHRPIHVAVQGPGSRIFLDQMLDAGDTYRVPNMKGLKLSAVDAGAIEIILDDTTVGFASQNGGPARNLPLDPQSIIDRQRHG
jgi:cytoskeleton protein RodZ